MSIRRYSGRGTMPLGLDRFASAQASSRSSPGALRRPCRGSFDNEYISGILTTQGSFTQKYGYFEMRSKIPAWHRRVAGILDARR